MTTRKNPSSAIGKTWLTKENNLTTGRSPHQKKLPAPNPHPSTSKKRPELVDFQTFFVISGLTCKTLCKRPLQRAMLKRPDISKAEDISQHQSSGNKFGGYTKTSRKHPKNHRLLLGYCVPEVQEHFFIQRKVPFNRA
jgi:hypothetical protein